MLLFFLVSPIRNRFFFESIWKKIVSFFIKRDSKGMRSPLQGFINNIENAILILCLLHQRRNPISRRETRKIIPSRYLSRYYAQIYIYIYIIRTSVSQFLRESKREDRSGLIIVKGISNWSSCRNWKLRGFSGKFSLCTSSFHRGYGRYVARGNSHPPPLI